MRVVWATRHLPDPAGGGGAVSEHQTILEAARVHEIVVVTGGLAPGATHPALEALGVEYRGVAWQPRARPAGRAALLRQAARGPEPLAVWEAQPCAAAVGAAVAEIGRARPVDVVSVFPGEMAAVAAAAPAPAALLLADCYTVQCRRERAAATTARHRLLHRLDERIAARWERAAYRVPAAVACVSGADQPVLEELSGRPVEIIPLPLGPQWVPAPERAPGGDVVFVGALDYRPNVDAVGWLATAIWPLVRAAAPQARLQVVGRSPVDEVQAVVAAAGGALHADVEDVRPWYWGAGVVVAPVRLGSGTRNKVLHAVACGAPLVATSVAMEGIGNDGVTVRDDAEGFARAVVEALADPAAARARAGRARALLDGHEPGRVVERLSAWWERACGSSS